MSKNETNENELLMLLQRLDELLDNEELDRESRKRIRNFIAFPGSNRAFIELLGLWHQSIGLRRIIEVGLKLVLKQKYLESYGHAMLEAHCHILAFLKSIYYPKEQEGSFSAIASAIETIILANQWRCNYSIVKIREYSQQEHWPAGENHSKNLDLFFRQLHDKSLTEDIQPGSSEKIKTSMAISIVWSISKAIIRPFQTFQADEFTTKVLLVESPVTSVSGKLAVKLIDGFGVFVPEPDMVFIKLDDEFYEGIENATRYLSNYFPKNFKNKNLSWKISWEENKDGVNIYTLQGPSAGAAMIAAAAQELAIK